jgi:hypothetical protein
MGSSKKFKNKNETVFHTPPPPTQQPPKTLKAKWGN